MGPEQEGGTKSTTCKGPYVGDNEENGSSYSERTAGAGPDAAAGDSWREGGDAGWQRQLRRPIPGLHRALQSGALAGASLIPES